jgi:hypothetical protein
MPEDRSYLKCEGRHKFRLRFTIIHQLNGISSGHHWRLRRRKRTDF